MCARYTLTLEQVKLVIAGRVHIFAFAQRYNIGAAQRAGRVKDFWPFYCRVIDRYVGLNAEEIQTEARSLSGARSLGDVLGPLLQRLQSATLPDLIAQRRAETAEAKKDTLRSRLARQRAQEAARKAAASQPQLF